MRGRRACMLGSRFSDCCRWAILCLIAFGGSTRVLAQATSSPSLSAPSAIAYDTAGNLFIADAKRHQVLEATLAGSLLVVAGTGVQGYAGDGGSAAAAELNSPQGLAVGSDGTLYIADTGNARIRAVTAGAITTFAGTGTPGFGGDSGPATAAAFRQPTALALDATGALLVCDTGNQRVRRIVAGSIPTVTTLAGTGVQGFTGDGGAATTAELDSPMGVAVASDGRVFIADTHNQRVRAIVTSGIISTVAGTGKRGYAGDGLEATLAQISEPRGLAVTGTGVLLIADGDNQRVRSVDGNGIIGTVAGAGTQGASNEGVPATQAALQTPRALALSALGMPVLADTLNDTVRIVTPSGLLFSPAALAPGRVSAMQTSWTLSQTYGQVSASVAVSGSVGTPQGTVTFTDAGTPLASTALLNGSGMVSSLALNAGQHSLTVSYAGDGLNPAATSGAGTLTVLPAQATVIAAGASMTYGSPVPALSGSLSGVLPGDTEQVSAVFSSIAGALTDVGMYPITAALVGPKSGDYVLQIAAGSGSLQIKQAGSATTLGSVPQSYAGLPLRLTASVASNTSGQPTGTVQFLDGSNVVATAVLVNGSAYAIYVAPPAGTLNLVAQYSGNTDFTRSSSAVQTAVVGAFPDFALSVTGAATATVLAGSVASYTVTAAAQPAPFTGDVTFSVTGLPAGATVAFSPPQVVPGAGAATVEVSVQTVASAASIPPHDVAGETYALAGLALWAGWRRRRRRLLSPLLAVVCLLSGCGARNVGETTAGLSTHSYTLGITGTSTNLIGATVSHTTSVTLSVQE